MRFWYWSSLMPALRPIPRRMRAAWRRGRVAKRCEESRRFYDRKRAEFKCHIQAVLVLARRRVNVLGPLLRNGRRYELSPTTDLAA